MSGTYVPLIDMIRSFKEILNGKYDYINENHFYMKGSIEEVLTSHKKASEEKEKVSLI